MRTIWMLAVAMVVAGGLSGCVTDAKLRSQNMQLRQESESLKSQVKQRDQSISRLNQEVDYLKGEVTFFTQKTVVLEKEKGERIRDTDALGKGVRQFTDAVRKSLETSIPDVMVYIGGEICNRDASEPASGVLLIDRHNKFAIPMQIVGGRYFSRGATKAQFCILRDDPAKPGSYLVVAISSECATEGSGVQTCPFTEPLRADAGDFPALYCVTTAGIPYDSKGTGDVAEVSFTLGKLKEGDSVTVKTPPAGRDSRAYSFCVIGNPSGGE